jgi:hypothetical protein
MTSPKHSEENNSILLLSTKEINELAKYLGIKLPHEKMEQKEFEEFLAEKKLHLIMPEKLSIHEKATVAQVTESLLNLKKDVDEKKEFIEKNIKAINEKVEMLTKSNKVKINHKEREQAKENVSRYSMILDNIAMEIIQELSFFAGILSETPPKAFVVPISFPNSFIVYLVFRIKGGQRYVKNIVKNITVSFSRYRYSFEEQLKRLDVMQHYISEQPKE